MYILYNFIFNKKRNIELHDHNFQNNDNFTLFISITQYSLKQKKIFVYVFHKVLQFQNLSFITSAIY